MKAIKGRQKERKGSKYPYLLILYKKDHKYSIRKFLQHINTHQGSRIQADTQKASSFLIQKWKTLRKKRRKEQHHSQEAQKISRTYLIKEVEE